MLRLLYPQGIPTGIWPIDPTVAFQAGMIGGLKQIGGEIVMTISDGVSIQPYGIIDDMRDKAFQKPSVDESVIVPAVADSHGKTLVDVMGLLKYPSVVVSSFIADVDVILNPVNGAITIPAGTSLNYDSNLDGVFDAVKVVCSYIRNVPDIPGDDTTMASGKMTVWFTRGEYATDQYDTTVAYPLNCTLYCGLDGRFTSKPNGPGIGMCTGMPSSLLNMLQFMWF